MKKIAKTTKRRLMRAALEARRSSYCPYSRFAVGAALLCADGTVVTGCNIENAAFTPGICAERTAFAKAVSEGKKEFLAVAVAGGKAGEEPEGPCAPCGVCRQVMAEFCGPDFLILTGSTEKEWTEKAFSELLPEPFGPGALL